MARRMRSSSASIDIGVAPASMAARARRATYEVATSWANASRSKSSQRRDSAPASARDERLLDGLDDLLERSDRRTDAHAAHLGRTRGRSLARGRPASVARRGCHHGRHALARIAPNPVPRPATHAGSTASDVGTDEPGDLLGRPRRRLDDDDATARTRPRAAPRRGAAAAAARGTTARHDDRVRRRPWRTATPASGPTGDRRRRATPARRRRAMHRGERRRRRGRGPSGSARTMPEPGRRASRRRRPRRARRDRPRR